MPTDNLLFHIVRVRPRLASAVLFGAAAALLVPGSTRLLTHFLVGWNTGVWSYLAMIGWMMSRASPATARAIASREDATAGAVLAFMSVAGLTSLAAIVLELSAVKSIAPANQAVHYALTGSTLLGSWLLVNVMFTLHYAHMYYRAPEAQRPLRFPDLETLEPDYWDFLYFSFTIAVAAQTSDIAVLARAMRKVVLAQSVLSFLFNAAIIGLSINVAAGLIGG